MLFASVFDRLAQRIRVDQQLQQGTETTVVSTGYWVVEDSTQLLHGGEWTGLPQVVILPVVDLGMRG